MNGNNIIGGGNIQATIYGIDIRTLSVNNSVDYGTFTEPNTFTGMIDLGSF